MISGGIELITQNYGSLMISGGVEVSCSKLWFPHDFKVNKS